MTKPDAEGVAGAGGVDDLLGPGRGDLVFLAVDRDQGAGLAPGHDRDRASAAAARPRTSPIFSAIMPNS